MAGIVVNADALCLHQGVAVRFDYLCERFYICCFPHFFIYLMITFLLLWRYTPSWACSRAYHSSCSKGCCRLPFRSL